MKLDRFWRDGPGVPIGRITNHAQKRLPGFKRVYSGLSKYAHPSALSILASHRATEGQWFEWSSAPRFRFDVEQLFAYAWAVELADATANLLRRFAVTFRLVTPQTTDE
jgi:hypothetical protein